MSSSVAPAGVAAPLPSGVTPADPLVVRAVERLGLHVRWLVEFCERWGIATLSLFGSVPREDFRAESDADVLVEYMPAREVIPWGVVRMPAEFAEAVGRSVDIVQRDLLVNPYRRSEILATARLLYRRP